MRLANVFPPSLERLVSGGRNILGIAPAPNNIETKKWADLFAEELIRQGVDVVFTYPGGASLELQDALGRYKIKRILVSHEQGAIFAAIGYSRSSKKTGVILVTSGPGILNTFTGQADAFKDSIDVVAFGGQVPTWALKKDAFQGVDAARAAVPITKKVYQFRNETPRDNLFTRLRNWYHNEGYEVVRAEDLESVIGNAFRVARSGKPGSVYVEITKDVSQKIIAVKPEYRGRNIYAHINNAWNSSRRLARKPLDAHHNLQNRKNIDRALEAILNAESAVIYWGGGVISAEAQPELLYFMQRTGIPGVHTLHGKDNESIPDDYPLNYGMLGMHGSFWANYMLRHRKKGKVVIALGVKFDDRVVLGEKEFAQDAEIIHVDIEPSQINKIKKADYPIVGNVKDVIAYWNEKLKDPKYNNLPAKFRRWRDEVDEVRRQHPLDYDNTIEGLMPQQVFETVNECVAEVLAREPGRRVHYTTGVGKHQLWAGQLAKYGKFYSSGGLGSMGYGLPTALGVQAANPEDIVINLDGDGSFNISGNEVATGARSQLPVITVILNDGHLGMVTQWQKDPKGYQGRITDSKFAYGKDNKYPDFAKIAEGYGAVGIRADNLTDLKAAIHKGLANRTTPTVIDARTVLYEVFPMIRPRQNLGDIILDPSTHRN